MTYRAIDSRTRTPISGDVSKEEAERIANLYNREMHDDLAAEVIRVQEKRRVEYQAANYF